MIAPRTHRRRQLAGACLLLALTVLGAGAPGAAAADPPPAPPPPCLGAAARDPEHPCTNPGLRLAVSPTPDQARKLPNSPCVPFDSVGSFGVCGFGAGPERATAGAVALVGDSHAIHWRAAVDAVAQAHGWAARSITLSSCAFSKAETAIREPGRSRCRRWNRQVPRWLAAHPEVHTLFVSYHAGGSVVAPSGVGQFEARVRGYIDMWGSLPASVQHILVIRDAPNASANTPGCVTRALAKRMRPQFACARKRSQALRPDAQVVAARRLRSPRVQVVDLTRFFCSSRLCYPVVGGILTHKDIGHITVAYVTTLGPYLLRKVDRLMQGWATPT